MKMLQGKKKKQMSFWFIFTKLHNNQESENGENSTSVMRCSWIRQHCYVMLHTGIQWDVKEELYYKKLLWKGQRKKKISKSFTRIL